MTLAEQEKVNGDLLRPLLQTSARFYVLVAFFAFIVALGVGAFLYQVYFGIGVWGIRWPVF